MMKKLTWQYINSPLSSCGRKKDQLRIQSKRGGGLSCAPFHLQPSAKKKNNRNKIYIYKMSLNLERSQIPEAAFLIFY